MPFFRSSRRPPLRLPGHSLIQLEVLELDDRDLAKVVGGLASEGHYIGRSYGLGATASGECGYTSCFVAGTLIATEEGQVPVETLAPFTRAPGVLRPAAAAVSIATGAAGPEAAAIVDLELLTGHRISVSEYHPFPARSARSAGEARGRVRTLPALSLTPGQELQVLDARTNQLIWTPITALRRRSYDRFVYNICLAAPETPREHLLLANGIVTGDLFIQLHLVESVRVEAARRLTRGEAVGPMAQELAVSESVLDEWRRAYLWTPQKLYGETRLVRAVMRAVSAA